MRRTIAWAAIVSLTFLQSSDAQTFGPTENDLLAGYCLGVAQAMRANAAAIADFPECKALMEDPAFCRETAEIAADANAEAEALRQRFARYILARDILARGYYPGGPMARSFTGLNLMRENG